MFCRRYLQVFTFMFCCLNYKTTFKLCFWTPGNAWQLLDYLQNIWRNSFVKLQGLFPLMWLLGEMHNPVKIQRLIFVTDFLKCWEKWVDIHLKLNFSQKFSNSMKLHEVVIFLFIPENLVHTFYNKSDFTYFILLKSESFWRSSFKNYRRSKCCYVSYIFWSEKWTNTMFRSRNNKWNKNSTILLIIVPNFAAFAELFVTNVKGD